MRACAAGETGSQIQIAGLSNERRYVTSGSYGIKYEDMQKLRSEKATLERTDR